MEQESHEVPSQLAWLERLYSEEIEEITIVKTIVRGARTVGGHGIALTSCYHCRYKEGV